MSGTLFQYFDTMTTWGCPHEINGHCTRIQGLPCDPGMKGCVLAGRYVFANSEEKSTRYREKVRRQNGGTPPEPDCCED